jgi:hypothetical protein
MIAMAGEGEPQASDDDGDGGQSSVVGLAWWERIAAGLVGAAGGTAGTLAVFHTSNQAGSAALLLLSSIFLLISVQGTAIRRANRELLELDRRTSPRVVIRRAEEVLLEGGTAEAKQFLDGAVASNPILADSPQVAAFESSVANAEQYEHALMGALWAISNGLYSEVHRSHYDLGADFTLTSKTQDKVVHVDVKYGNPDRLKSISAAMSRAVAASKRAFPTIIVTNMDISVDLKMLLPERGHSVEIVTWRGAADNAKLREAIVKAFAD